MGVRVGIRTGSSQIHDYWDNEQIVAGEFMQLFDWAKPNVRELRGLLDQLSFAVFVDDSSSTCLVSNSAFAKLFGVDASESPRSRWPRCDSNDRSEEIATHREKLWRDGNAYSASAEIEVADGITRWIWTRVIPIQNADGEVIRSVGIAIDIHDRVLARLKLERSEQQFRSLIEDGADPIIAIDSNKAIQIWNYAAEKMFGYKADEALGASISLLLPTSSAAKHHGLVEGYVHGAEQDRDLLGSPVKALRKDGTTIDVEINLAKVALGHKTLSVATIRDVTLRENIRSEERKTEAKFGALVELSQDPILIVDHGETVLYANPAIEAITGQTPSQIIGSPLGVIMSLVHKSDHDRVSAAMTKAKLRPSQNTKFTYSQIHSDGKLREIEAGITDYRDVDGLEGLVISLRDISEATAVEQRLQLQNSQLKSVHRALAHKAAHDGLTGLANKISFTEQLDSAIANASVGILFLDLDGFKQINDTLGHAAGDELLIEVARRLKSTVRPTDTVARVGGDEFVIMCPRMSGSSEAEALAKRVRKVMQPAFAVNNTTVSISTSIGIAFSKDGDRDANAVLTRADAAMYNAKNLGRARSQIFEDSMLDIFTPSVDLALAN